MVYGLWSGRGWIGLTSFTSPEGEVGPKVRERVTEHPEEAETSPAGFAVDLSLRERRRAAANASDLHHAVQSPSGWASSPSRLIINWCLMRRMLLDGARLHARRHGLRDGVDHGEEGVAGR